MQAGEVGPRLARMAQKEGCSLSLLFHNVRSAGKNLELLEVEMGRCGVVWDVVGVAETWLNAESEKGVGLSGYGGVYASRKDRGGLGLLFL